MPLTFDNDGTAHVTFDVRCERLRDGSTGWYVVPPRTDSCFQAAVATCLQLPISDIPDPHLDERHAAGEDPAKIDRSARLEMDRWLADRGLRMVVHRAVPVDLPRWIGIVALPGWWQSHCLCMSFNELLFDPTLDWFRRQERLRSPLAPFGRALADMVDPPRQPRVWQPAQISYGVSFESTMQRSKT